MGTKLPLPLSSRSRSQAQGKAGSRQATLSKAGLQPRVASVPVLGAPVHKPRSSATRSTCVKDSLARASPRPSKPKQPVRAAGSFRRLVRSLTKSRRLSRSGQSPESCQIPDESSGVPLCALTPSPPTQVAASAAGARVRRRPYLAGIPEWILQTRSGCASVPVARRRHPGSHVSVRKSNIARRVRAPECMSALVFQRRRDNNITPCYTTSTPVEVPMSNTSAGRTAKSPTVTTPVIWLSCCSRAGGSVIDRS